ncbi:hypothetical protein PuT2_02050 [Pusillimonas sp. T2]|uniref:hypothetical protein n=1 Tax=Pusillimonas sp. T2 TaxID=1548123 RepID=UPI000B9D0AF5|nr:hypothetical protein [Pusillimonas sp. T2]OXR50671.1 hypothetical protein PuT2_02050 [Pusillimonas sp. T2]
MKIIPANHRSPTLADNAPYRREAAQAAYVLPSLMKCYMPPSTGETLARRLGAWLSRTGQKLKTTN